MLIIVTYHRFSAFASVFKPTVLKLTALNFLQSAISKKLGKNLIFSLFLKSLKKRIGSRSVQIITETDPKGTKRSDPTDPNPKHRMKLSRNLTILRFRNSGVTLTHRYWQNVMIKVREILVNRSVLVKFVS